MSEITTINVFALFKNSEPHLARTLFQFDNLISLKDFKWNFFFYGNDHRDNTNELLNEWAKTHSGLTIINKYEVLNAPSFGSVTSNVRTSILAHFRNKCKSLSNGTYSNLSLVIDTDLEWKNSDFLSLYNTYKSLPDCVGVTGSTIQSNISDLTENIELSSFYDLFPFRDKDGNPGCYFSRTPFYLNEDRENFLAGLPVQISSGFGGMALYDSFAYESCWYSGEFGSEHQSFSYQMRNYGKLYVDPNCKPVTNIDLSTVSIEACRKIGAENLQRMKIVNKLHEWSMSMEYKFELSRKG